MTNNTLQNITIILEKEMFGKNKKRQYDYYEAVKTESDEIFEEYKLHQYIKAKNIDNKEKLEKIYKEKLYNILLNIINQEVYDEIYNFSKEDVEFILNFNIDKIMKDIIKRLKKYMRNK